MKKLLIFLSLLFACTIANAETAYEYLNIKKITSIEISLYSPGNWKSPSKHITTKDKKFINQLTSLLKKIDSTGDTYKDFGDNVRHIEIKLIMRSGTKTLHIYSCYLYATKNGAAYCSSPEGQKKSQEFIASIDKILADNK